MDGGLVRLREVFDSLTPSEKKIAEYILRDPDQLISLSVAELARRSGGSQTAVIRLCKSMGLAGYQDLKIKVIGDLRESESSGYREIHPQDSIADIVNNVSGNNIQSIRDTVKILDIEMVENAVHAMDRAERLFFYGLGPSSLIAQDAQQKFLRINKSSFSFMDFQLQLTSAVTLSDRDVAVGISYTGDAPHFLSCMQAAKGNRAVTISITKYGNTPVSKYTDIPLYVSSSENDVRSAVISSRITQLNVIDILYLGVAGLNYEVSSDYLERGRKALHEWTDKRKSGPK